MKKPNRGTKPKLKNFLQSGPSPTLQEPKFQVRRTCPVSNKTLWVSSSLKKPTQIIDTMPIATPQGTLDFKSVDTITFVGASSNTVIDTTTGSLGVGVDANGPTSNLHVVGHTRLEGDINMLHTSNTASIKLNSNVVTEFPRSKKLIKYPRVALGTNASPYSGVGSGSTVSGYTIKASGEYSNSTSFYASRAFSSYPDTWITLNTAYTGATGLPVANSANVTKFGQEGSWLEIKLPNKILLNYTQIFSRPDAPTERTDTADIWASNTGNDGDWVKLTTINFNDTYTHVIPMVADIDTRTYYQYFAIQITKIGWGGTYANIGEWELFGTPEYDPEADGTDVVVKSVPNVPNTDWLEVYYDAKGLPNGAVTNPISGLGGTTINGTATNVTVSDGAFVFDGTSDIRSTVSTFTGDQPHTMSVWVNISTSHTLGDGYICVLAPSTGENPNQVSTIRYQNDGFNLQSWGNDIQMYNIGVEKGRWYHLVAVYDGGGVTTSSKRLYIDTVRNTRISGNTTTGDEIDFANTTLSLGSRVDGTSSHLTGSIANFRLFNRALTSDEIYQLYAYQKEYFGHGDLGMTLKAGRLGIGTSEPRAALDVRGDVNVEGRVLSGHASGGTESVVDGYKIHTFTTSSNFNVVTPGVVEYLIIGGGGGGGGTHGAGGGGGGFIQGHALVKSGSHSIVVGGGGTGSTAQGANGVNSTAFGLTAVGGGGGGRGYDATSSSAGNIGGSSGGSGPFVLTGSDSRDFGKVPEKTYTNRYQGNGGGGGNNTSGAGHGGGGGGAGGPGGNATTTSDYYAGNGISGAGGSGLVSYITGSPVIYAGGGSGGRWSGSQSINVQGGVGGTNGGGGIGGAIGASGMAATAGGINTGGGGGGGSDNGGRGGNGGSGIVVLRYPV